MPIAWQNGELTGQDAGGDTEVDRDHDESCADRVLALEDAVLGDQEDDGTEDSSDTRSDTPSGENLGNTRPAPVDTVSADGSDTHSDDTAHDGMGSRDWHTEARGQGEVEGGGDEGTGHSQHEDGWVGLEELGGEDLGANGIGDTATDTEGTSELHNGGQNHGLLEGDGSRRDGCGPSIGDIVST